MQRVCVPQLSRVELIALLSGLKSLSPFLQGSIPVSCNKTFPFGETEEREGTRE